MEKLFNIGFHVLAFELLEGPNVNACLILADYGSVGTRHVSTSQTKLYFSDDERDAILHSPGDFNFILPDRAQLLACSPPCPFQFSAIPRVEAYV